MAKIIRFPLHSAAHAQAVERAAQGSIAGAFVSLPQPPDTELVIEGLLEAASIVASRSSLPGVAEATANALRAAADFISENTRARG